MAELLLFCANPNRFPPQAGIDAVAYPGKKKDYAAKERLSMRGPMTALIGKDGVMASPPSGWSRDQGESLGAVYHLNADNTAWSIHDTTDTTRFPDGLPWRSKTYGLRGSATYDSFHL